MMIDSEKNSFFYDNVEWDNTLLLPLSNDRNKLFRSFNLNNQNIHPINRFDYKDSDDSSISAISTNNGWSNCSLEASLERLLIDATENSNFYKNHHKNNCVNSIENDNSENSDTNGSHRNSQECSTNINRESYESWQYLVNKNSWNDSVSPLKTGDSSLMGCSWNSFSVYEKIGNGQYLDEDYQNLSNLSNDPSSFFIENSFDPLKLSPSKTNVEQYSLPESPITSRYKNHNFRKCSTNFSTGQVFQNIPINQTIKGSKKANHNNKLFSQGFSSDNKLKLRNPTYSRKVFIGGLPHDISQENLIESFSSYGGLTVDWPHKNESLSNCPPKGYAFLLFKDYDSVDKLISNCFKQKNEAQSEDKFYYKVSSPMMADKTVQIKPWLLKNIEYSKENSPSIDLRKTIFIGGIPRPLKAAELYSFINSLYGNVCHAAIDVDPDYLYPKGAGRVTFITQCSYLEAIKSRFLQMSTCDAGKRIEVKPYFPDDQKCDNCSGLKCENRVVGLFCTKPTCLLYLCDSCWKTVHSVQEYSDHVPAVKGTIFQPFAHSNASILNVSQLIDE